jgi:hypothetical protein
MLSASSRSFLDEIRRVVVTVLLGLVFVGLMVLLVMGVTAISVR